MSDNKTPVKPTTTPDARLSRDRDAPRSDARGGEERVFSNRDWEEANAPTDPERRRALRERWSQSLLPNLPKKDGWHRCWCSTTHPSDTVARRIAVGYTLLKMEDIATAGWAPQAESVKDGEFAGAVRWREMIGMQIPQDQYLEIMRELHHDLPLDMARDIYGGLQQGAEEIRDRGGKVEFGDGFQEMGRFRRAPTQFE
jgi:hypothetical protein